MNIETLDGLTAGCYEITTSHGTKHIIDLDAKTAIRQGAPGREWGNQAMVADPQALLSGYNPKIAVNVFPITGDGEVLNFTSISGATVGKSMCIENLNEWRTSSPIVSIKKIEDARYLSDVALDIIDSRLGKIGESGWGWFITIEDGRALIAEVRRLRTEIKILESELGKYEKH